MSQNTKITILFEKQKPYHDKWVEVKGCIVNTDWDNIESEVLKRIKDGYSISEIEKAINHIHISMLLELLHCPNTSENREEVFGLYAKAITDGLKKQFPDKIFKVEKLENHGEMTLVYYQT